MTQVAAIRKNNSSCFAGNDAFSLGISEESPPNFISFVLNDNELNSKKQCFDKDNKEKSGDDSALHSASQDKGVPSATVMTTVGSNISLNALAKNHFERNKTVNPWCCEPDLNLSDILSNTEDEDLGSNLHFFNVLANTQGKVVNGEFSTPQENDICIDLSDLVLDSCQKLSFHPADSTSLDFLAVNHIQKNSNNGTSTKDDNSDHLQSFDFFNDALSNGKEESSKNSLGNDILSELSSLDSLAVNHIQKNSNNGSSTEYNKNSSFTHNLKDENSEGFLSFGFFNDILSKEDNSKNSSENDILSELSELSSYNSSEISEEKLQSSEETSDDGLFPDIDLSFCIKKNSKDEFSTESSSPGSFDSGFEENNAIHKKLVANGHKKSIFGSNPFETEKLSKVKSSLFSKAISARPKIDEERSNKLKKVRCEFFRKQISPVVTNSRDLKQSSISDRIVDESDECVVTSDFLTFQFINLHSNIL